MSPEFLRERPPVLTALGCVFALTHVALAARLAAEER